MHEKQACLYGIINHKTHITNIAALVPLFGVALVHSVQSPVHYSCSADNASYVQMAMQIPGVYYSHTCMLASQLLTDLSLQEPLLGEINAALTPLFFAIVGEVPILLPRSQLCRL